ncbi:MAG: hypothetical protein H6727_04940 [Myxococcales bacterium]|nr:hypothetical protein [Myxococcales bacterium]
MRHRIRNTSFSLLRGTTALLGWVLCLSLVFSCTGNEECVNGVMTVTYDPNNNPCKTDCECNNLKFEGHCVNSRCLSFSRKPIDTTDKFLHCRLFYPIKTCVWGLRDPKPDPIKEELWGDCRYYEVGPEDTKDKCIDGKDNDCNGRYDSSEPSCAKYCKDTSQTRSCYEGPAGTANQGRCRPGLQTCETTNEWGSCQNQIVPQEETCNQQDDDCDGNVDEQLANCSFTPCSEGARRPCYPFASGCTRGENDTLTCKGACQTGFQLCRRGFWGACEGMQPPQAEACDQVDNDCDGNVDEGCLCEDGQTQDCFKGPSKTSTGICGQGKQTCQNGRWNSCDGAKEPKVEECNGQDDDCDGLIDENLPSQLCENQKGACSGAFKTCGGERGFLVCTEDEYRRNNSLHAKEEQGTDCDNNDNDCDGKVDEDCVGCSLGSSRICYEGAQGTENTQPCRQGISLCTRQDNGVFVFGPCVGQVTPQAETCNGRDDDCDGVIDNPSASPPLCPTGQRCVSGQCTQDPEPNEPTEPNEPISDAGEPTPELPPPLCILGTAEYCYNGTGTTYQNPPCEQGFRVCIKLANGDLAWSKCTGQVTPKIEICNGIDDNCDGTVDNDDGQGQLCPPNQVCTQGRCVPQEVPPQEPTTDAGPQPEGLPDGALCAPNQVQPCYTGPQGTLAKGTCKEGTQTCQSNGKWGTCQGDIKPAKEICNGLDDDCNGVIDDPDQLRSDTTRVLCTNQQGVCLGATAQCGGTSGWLKTCTNQDYQSFTNSYEAVESSCDKLDNDCDGKIDEGCLWAGGFANSINSYDSTLGFSGWDFDNTNKTIWIGGGRFGYKNISWIPTQSSSAVPSFVSPPVNVGATNAVLIKMDTGGIKKCLFESVTSPRGDTVIKTLIVHPQSGDVIVLGSYTGTAKFGPYTLSTQNNRFETFVARIDPQCQIKWITREGSPSYSYTARLSNYQQQALSPQGDIHCFTSASQGTVTFGTGSTPDFTLSLLTTTGSINTIATSNYVVCQQVSDGKFIWATQMGSTGNSSYSPVYDILFDNDTLHVVGQTCYGVFIKDQQGNLIQTPRTSAYPNGFQGGFILSYHYTGAPNHQLYGESILSFPNPPGSVSLCNNSNQNYFFGYKMAKTANNMLHLFGDLRGKANVFGQDIESVGTKDALLVTVQYDKAQKKYTYVRRRHFFSALSDNTPVPGAGAEGRELVADSQGNLYLGGNFQDHLSMAADPATGTTATIQSPRIACKQLYNQAAACLSAGSIDLFLAKLDSTGNFVTGFSAGGTSEQKVGRFMMDEAAKYLYITTQDSVLNGNFDYHSLAINGTLLWQTSLP